MSLPITELRESFELVAPQADVLATRFYERLFDEHPELSPLFARVNLPEQRRKLVQSLTVVVKSLEQQPVLERMLRDLGGRHRDYGVNAEDYPVVADVLIRTLAEVAGDQWNSEYEAAWQTALGVIAELMLAGAAAAEDAERQAILDELSAAPVVHSQPATAAAIGADDQVETTTATLSAPETLSPPETEPSPQALESPETAMSNTLQQTAAGDSTSTATGSTDAFYALVEHSPLPHILVDSGGVVSYVNTTGQELLRELEATTNVTCTEIVGGNLATLTRALPGLPVNNGTRLTQKLTVGKHTLNATSFPLTNSNGQGVGQAYALQNVSDEVELRTEAAAHDSRSDAISKAMAVIEFELDGTIVSANDNFCATLGYTQAEIIGQHHRMFVDTQYAASAEYQDFWAKLNRGEFVAGEFPRLGKNGSIIWIQASYNPILNLDGRPTGVIKYASDVTEAVLERVEFSKMKSVIEQLPVNVMMIDLDLKLVFMNEASKNTLRKLEHILPIPVDKMIGTKIDVFHKVPEMQRKLLADPKNLPHSARIKIGSETADLRVSAVYDATGKHTGAIAHWGLITHQVKMADDFESNVKGVVQSVTAAATEMQASSRSMASMSEQTARQSQVVAAASEQTTKNVETVSSAAEELSASISEIARHVQDASQMTSQAVSEAEKTNVTISHLGEASDEIGQVIKVITSIAQQTNLLALNATIEAARAGEAGKGFAVVANEVKELARQTAKATEEISQKIGAIQSSTGVAVGAIESIRNRINRMDEIATTIASAVEEQAAATNEISRNVAEAARGTGEVTSNIGQVSSAAEEAGRGAGEIQSAADGLAVESARLDEVTTNFLEQLRSL